jgi:hypothetical protein
MEDHLKKPSFRDKMTTGIEQNKFYLNREESLSNVHTRIFWDFFTSEFLKKICLFLLIKQHVSLRIILRSLSILNEYLLLTIHTVHVHQGSIMYLA